MDELQVIPYNKFDLDKLIITRKYDTKLGDRHYILLRGNDVSIPKGEDGFELKEGEKFYLDTPIMLVPFGIDRDNEKLNKFYLKAEFYNIKGNEEIKEFHKKLLELEKKVKEELKDKYKAKYFTNIKNTDIPSMKLKVPFRYGRSELEVFDSKGNRKTIYDIESGSKCKFILHPLEIWLNDVYYGILWSVKAAIIINSFNQK